MDKVHFWAKFMSKATIIINCNGVVNIFILCLSGGFHTDFSTPMVLFIRAQTLFKENSFTMTIFNVIEP